MERKVKLGMSVITLLGIIYSMIGAVFFVLGCCLSHLPSDEEAKTVGFVFTLLGAVFLVLGAIFLVLTVRKKRQAVRLVSGGRFLWGQIVEFTPNLSIRVNNRHPYVAVVRYMDPSGVSHVFRSRNLYCYPDPNAVGRQVRIYIENDRYKPYYVDIDPALPPVIEH